MTAITPLVIGYTHLGSLLVLNTCGLVRASVLVGSILIGYARVACVDMMQDLRVLRIAYCVEGKL